MTEAERAYWSIIAQVLPVLGLALVLEIRTLAQAVKRARGGALTFDGPKTTWVRWLMLNFVVGGAGVLFGTISAVDALATDNAPSNWVASATRVATSVALGVTLSNPVIFAVMATEPGAYFYRLARSEPEAQRSIRRIRRKGRDLRARLVRLRVASFDHLQSMQRMTARLDRLWDDVQHLPPGDAHRDEVAAERADVATATDGASQRWREVMRMEHNIQMFNSETMRYLHEVLAIQRDASTRQMARVLARLDVTAGVMPGSGGVPLLVLFDDAPDDGGFLYPQPMRVPDWPVPEPGWLTSPEAFYTGSQRGGRSQAAAEESP